MSAPLAVATLPPVACVRTSLRFVACELRVDWLAAARERVAEPDERAAFALAREALGADEAKP